MSRDAGSGRVAFAPSATKSVLVTGASSGIGRAIALDLDRAGHRVFAGLRRPEDADTLREAAVGALAPVRLDVADAASIRSAVDAVRTALGDRGLDGLVNNAGVAFGGPLEFVALPELRKQFEVNVFGLVAVTQGFLPLIRQASGRVVNISSMAGAVASPLMGPYSASKFAVEAISDTLRQELAPWGVRVCVVQPGAIKTPIWDKSHVALDTLFDAGLPELHRLYGADLEQLRAFVVAQEAAALPPQAVADVVRHALTSTRPRTRYPVGADARLGLRLRRWLPDRWFDVVLARLDGRA